MQQNENLFSQGGNGNKWYWNNAKTRAEGFEESKKMGGNRENENDWRRADKIIVGDFTDIEIDTTGIVDTLKGSSPGHSLPNFARQQRSIRESDRETKLKAAGQKHCYHYLIARSPSHPSRR